MTDIQRWSELAANNDQVAPDGSPELMKRSDVNNSVREIMRAARKFYAAAEFVQVYDTQGDAWAAGFSTNTQVKLTPQDAQTTDIKDRFPTGARVKLTGGASAQFGFITGQSFSTPNTFVDVVIDDGSNLDGATNLLEMGLLRDSLGKTAFSPRGTTTGQFPPEVPTIDDLGDQVLLNGGHDPEGDASPGIDADLLDGQHASQIIAASSSGASRNPIYNGEFMVWQRGTPIDADTNNDRTNVNDNALYCADRWMLLSGNSTSPKNDVMDVSLNTTAPPAGFWSNLKLTRTATVIAGQDFGGIFQILDGKDSAAFIGSSAVSISVWLKASAGITGAVVRVLGWTGTVDDPTADPIFDWGSAGADPTLVASWVSMIDSGQLAVDGVWTEFKTENEDISSFGTVKNIGILITTDDDSFGAADTLEITGVQMENSGTSSDFGHRDYGVELGRCQRYYTNSFDDGQDPRTAAGALTGLQLSSINRQQTNRLNLAASFVFPMIMRTTPTIKIWNAVNDVADTFYDDRDDNDEPAATFTETITQRRVVWSLVNQLGGRVFQIHAQAEAEF